jgi:addiction module RelB/DinJ family antitoxin
MPTQKDVRVTVRVDKDLKIRADKLFIKLGMNMTTALNVFLRKAVEEEAIPFAISAKTAAFGDGYAAADISNAFGTAVRDGIVASQRNGYPVARYDSTNKKAYLEASDGSREYVDG